MSVRFSFPPPVEPAAVGGGDQNVNAFRAASHEVPAALLYTPLWPGSAKTRMPTEKAPVVCRGGGCNAVWSPMFARSGTKTNHSDWTCPFCGTTGNPVPSVGFVGLTNGSWAGADNIESGGLGLGLPAASSGGSASELASSSTEEYRIGVANSSALRVVFVIDVTADGDGRMGKAEELQQAMAQVLQELEVSHAPQRNNALEIALVTFGANVKVWAFEKLSQLKKCHLLRGDEAKKENHDAGDSRIEKALFGKRCFGKTRNSGSSSFFAECWSSSSSSGGRGSGVVGGSSVLRSTFATAILHPGSTLLGRSSTSTSTLSSPPGGTRREMRCTGTALRVARLLLQHQQAETPQSGENTCDRSGRIVLLTRGPCTVGPGRVASLECGAFGIGEFAEEKGNSANSPIPKTPEVPDLAFSEALAFYNTELKQASIWSSAHQITYDVLALPAVVAGQHQDAGFIAQPPQAVGLDVLRGLCDKTGGMLAILQHASGVVRTVPRLLRSGSCKIEVLTTQCGGGGTLGSAFEFTGLLNAPRLASCAGPSSTSFRYHVGSLLPSTTFCGLLKARRSGRWNPRQSSIPNIFPGPPDHCREKATFVQFQAAFHDVHLNRKRLLVTTAAIMLSPPSNSMKGKSNARLGGDQPDVEAMVAAVAKSAVERLLEPQARPKSLSHLGGLLVQQHNYAYQLDDKKRTETENEHQNSTSSFDWLSGFAARVLKENATFELGVPASFRLHHERWRLLPAFCCFLQRKLQLLVGDMIKGRPRRREVDQDAAWLSAVRREAVPNVLLLLKPTLLRFEVLLCGSHQKKAPPPRAVPLSNLLVQQLATSVRVPEQRPGAAVVEESETSLHCHVLDSFAELRICRSAGLRSGFWTSGSGRSGSNNIKAATMLLRNVRESVEVIVEQRVPTPAVVEVVRADTLLAGEDFEAGAIAGVSAFENELVRGIVQGK